MIDFRAQGSIFVSGADALVNPVNCVGVAGAGLAKEFKERYPHNFELYRQACAEGRVRPRRVYITQAPLRVDSQIVINFPTKDDWKEPSFLGWIGAGLDDLAERILTESNIRSIAFPALGCGLGGLDWKDVFPLIYAFSQKLPSGTRVIVYGPGAR